MTGKEKLEKVRAEVKRLYNEEYGSAATALHKVLDYIDSLQKEPVSEDIVDEYFNEMLDPNIQYASREAGIMAHAEDYSFNIESELFQQLTPEQQKLWRKEIEQAVLSGGSCGLELANDKRYDKQEPVSEDLEEASLRASIIRGQYIPKEHLDEYPYDAYAQSMFKRGANWQKEHLWKPADGEDLPEINREVIALLGWGKVVFAHRPQEFWDGKDIITGEVTRNFPKTYDKGGWNIPDVKYWLDVELPKEIEL